MMNISESIQLAHFKVKSVLKKDDHSAVYLADDLKSGEIVILKTLKIDGLPDPSIIARFKRESKLLQTLNHPGIISAIESGSHENFLYISFEYFESKNLRTILNDGIKGNDDRFLIVKQFFSALKYAHENSIVHRDIKPENIFIANDGHLKIGDFGLATGGSENFVTAQFSVVGTPGYMSPEQILGHKLTAKSDLFSAGIVVYEVFKGKNPFIGQDVNETLNNIINFTDESLLEEFKSFPLEIIPILKATLKKEVSERDDSVYSLAEKLPGENKFYSRRSSKKIKMNYFYAAVIISMIVFAVYYFNQNLFWMNLKNNSELPEKVVQDDTSSLVFSDKLNSIDLPGAENTKVESPIQNEADKIKEVNSEIISTKSQVVEKSFGKLFVDCLPWATIYVDSLKYETTPLRENIQLSTGKYKVSLINPGYPVYSTEVKIEEGVVTKLKVNLESMVGYLDCKIHPWGEIFIDGEFKGETPLGKPIKLNPGEYKVLLKSKGYPDTVLSVKILQNETSILKYNFKNFN